MTQNQELNNTCILFDKDNIAQQEAIIKYYNDNGWPKTYLKYHGNENCIGVRRGELDYWYNISMFKVIDLPKEYYPIEQSTFLLTENNGETKPYYEVDKNGDKGYKTPIDNIVEDVKSEQTLEQLFKEHMKWAYDKFPNSSSESSIIGLAREIDELKDAMSDYRVIDGSESRMTLGLEYIDCFMYLLDSMNRLGFEIDEIRSLFTEKLRINKNRTWKQNDDKSYSHIK